MAMSESMSLPVRDTINELTPTAVAREMGLPISTVFRWMKSDRIPGAGAAHEWRRAQFEDAVKRLRARLETTPPAQEEARPRKRAATFPREAA